MYVRTYGDVGPLVVVLHGGPGAPGSAAGLARGLAVGFRVHEPFQRGSGEEPLTVARHVADLHGLVEALPDRPALVGWSWGAMLALAYAAEHPRTVGPLVVVGSGTFTRVARERMGRILDERMGSELRRRLDRLEAELPDPDRRLAALADLLGPLYDYEPTGPTGEVEADADAHRQTWEDMVRLQDQGTYPAALSSIRSPVLMIHGAYDPHPGGMIRASLQPWLPWLEYRELERCGHSPWRERWAREEFFAVVREWLTRHLETHQG